MPYSRLCKRGLFAHVVGEPEDAVALLVQFAVAVRQPDRQHGARHHDADDQHHDQDLDQREATLERGWGYSEVPVADVGIDLLPTGLIVGAQRVQVVFAVRTGDTRSGRRGPRDPCSGASRSPCRCSSARFAIGRLGLQRLQPLLGGRVAEVVELVQVERGSPCAWMSCLALAMRASSTLPISCVVTTAASRPMMTTTTMISIRVNPRCPALLATSHTAYLPCVGPAPIITKDFAKPVARPSPPRSASYGRSIATAGTASLC